MIDIPVDNFNWAGDSELLEAITTLLEVARETALRELAREAQREGPRPDIDEGAHERIDEELQALADRFKPVFTPRPVVFDIIIERMQWVEDSLGAYEATEDLDMDSDPIGGRDDFALVDTIKGDIDADWDGRFKNELIENYLTPLYPGIITTHGTLAQYLRRHAELMKMVYERRRSDAKRIAEDGTAALEAITDSQGDATKIFLSVIGGLIGLGTAVAGPLAAATSSQIAIGLASASFSAGNAVGGNFYPEEEEESPLGADTVEGVVDNIYKALGENDKKMKDEEDEILQSLQSVALALEPMVGADARIKGSDLIPLQPEVVGTVEPEELRDGLTSYPDDGGGDGGDGGDGGSGNYFGDDPPADWDGSVHNPPPVGIRMV